MRVLGESWCPKLTLPSGQEEKVNEGKKMVFDAKSHTPTKKGSCPQLQPKVIVRECKCYVAKSVYFSREARNLDIFQCVIFKI